MKKEALKYYGHILKPARAHPDNAIIEGGVPGKERRVDQRREHEDIEKWTKLHINTIARLITDRVNPLDDS